MAACGEIDLMLGAFEDGELEPNEMQEVAFHLARCQACTGDLASLSTIGRELRAIAPASVPLGFSAAVKRRIDDLPVPLTVRVGRYFDRTFGLIGSGIAWGAGMAAVAALTAILIAPYAGRFANRHPNTAIAMASLARSAVEAPRRLAAALPVVAIPEDQAAYGQDSRAVISRLEAEDPSVAVWSEPRTDTTVIWVPDRQQ
ncbi:MAG: anti-sigma factor family protein [Candidatus Binataceae bacterium]